MEVLSRFYPGHGTVFETSIQAMELFVVFFIQALELLVWFPSRLWNIQAAEIPVIEQPPVFGFCIPVAAATS